MAEYHVARGAFGILAGTVNKSRTMWKDKSDVTEEAIFSVAEYLLENKKAAFFTHKGRKYVMKVMVDTEV